MSELDPLPFASGLIGLDLESHALISKDGDRKALSEMQFLTLRPLALSLDNTVSYDTLIDETKPGIYLPNERYMQRLRVSVYINSLRSHFAAFYPEMSSVESSPLQNNYRRGYWLSSYWRKGKLSTTQQ